MAERWSQPPPKPKRASRRKPPAVDQPERLLKILRLPRETTEAQFMAAWRRYLKRNHPDLNPDQTDEERRRFAEAVALWKR